MSEMWITGNRLSVVVLLSIFASWCVHPAEPVRGGRADPRVRPGGTFNVSAPAGNGTAARADVYIPTDYTPDRAFPLLVWIEGLNGPQNTCIPYMRNNVTSGKEFILVSIPLPEGGKKIDCPWEYFEGVLNAVDQAVPNIKTGKRVVGGQAEGAAAISHQLSLPAGRFQQYFRAFIIGKGGMPVKGVSGLQNHQAFLFVGAHDFKEVANLKQLAPQLKKAGADVTLLISREFMHDPGGSHCSMFLKWMNEEVLYKGLAESKARLEKALKSENWAQVVSAAHDTMESSNPDMPEFAAAKRGFDEGCRNAAQMADELLAGDPGIPELRGFLEDFGVCPCSSEVREAANALAEKELERLLKRPGRPVTRVREFMKEWQGYPVYDVALAKYDEFAQAELEAILKRSSATTLARKLDGFIKEWTPAPATEKAREALETKAAEELAEIKKISSETSRSYRLKRLLRYFPGTKAAEEAQQLLSK